jgi:DNA (cytosine-5)-methyltransferase 1
MRVAGLFAGIGGIELGLHRAVRRGAKSAFETTLLCEFDDAAKAVLRARFPGCPIAGDVRELKGLPKGVELVTAGFPCQDLSQAGLTRGIIGDRSGLVGEVFRLLRDCDVPHLLIENVPFMLQLQSGAAMTVITDSLTRLGYRWAYRVLDAMAFGLPQRRQRVFLFASRELDPCRILFGSEHGDASPRVATGCARGFFWTEGERGLGWAVDAVPTMKGGSTIGVPSPPAIWMPDGSIVTPDVRDAERLQGFPADWTKPCESVVRSSFRWKQIGNAVAVPVASWVGRQLAKPSSMVCTVLERIAPGRRWPQAAALVEGEAVEVRASTWPIAAERPPLADFLEHPTRPLSARATLGFLQRLHKGSLRLEPGFVDAIETHLVRMGGTPPSRPERVRQDRRAVPVVERRESPQRHGARRRSSQGAVTLFDA